jgi:DNA-binding transcriptional MerR regulator
MGAGYPGEQRAGPERPGVQRRERASMSAHETDGGAGSHLSIGEVLAELRDEFPDITISKIRFLESQGLIDPERTPSGYRKFYDQDLVRLRWILHQQKAHFLPLKVIKERLDQLQPGEELLLDPSPLMPLTPGVADSGDAVDTAAGVSPESDASDPAVLTAPAAPTTPATTTRAPATAPRPSARNRPPTFVPRLPSDDGADDDAGPTSEQTYSPGELATAAGLEAGQVEQLESFGLIVPALEIAGEARYDADALEVAQAAAGFFSRGVEGRHLRMYRTFAEREAVLFGQVLLPYVRQRNPEARARLQAELIELSTLGRRLRTALLREAVRDSLAE